MALVPRFLLPVCALAYLPLACSSTDDGAGTKTPAPPSGGSASGGSATSAGTASGGSAGSATGGAGGSGGAVVKVGPGEACTTTPQCPDAGFKCNTATHVCDCSVDVPDTCGTGATAACVNKQSDPDNCGQCGMKCDAGATCVAGACGMKPVELTTGTGCGTIRLAISGANIYWTEATSGKVRSMPVAGGAPVDVATGQASPSQIAADDKGVYWLVDGDTTPGSSKIMKKALPMVAGAPDVLKAAPAADKILGITVNSGKLYYSLVHDVHQISTDKAVTADIIVGTAVNYDDPPKIEGIPHGVAVNATMLAWTDVGDRNGVEGDDLLEETATPLTDKTGYVELAQSVGALKADIAVDATYAYWLNGDQFVRNKLAATMPVPDPAVMVSPKEEFTAFAINATSVYASNKPGGIFKHSLIAPKDGDDTTIVAPVMIARDQMTPSSVVLDAAKAYWATSDCAIRSTGL
jgi:hypothetical protein